MGTPRVDSQQDACTYDVPVPIFRLASNSRRLSELLTTELNDPIKAASGAHVVDLDSGRTVFGLRHDEPRMMASTTKLFTAGTALTHLGAESTLTTRLCAESLPDSDGILHGDLVVIGDGDPLLGDEHFLTTHYGDVGTPVEHLVRAVIGAGVRHIRGGVVGDGSLYAREEQPSPSVTALSFNQSTADRPVRFAAQKIAEALTGAGVTIDEAPSARASKRDGLHEIGLVDSLSVLELLTICGHESDNAIAATLAKRSAAAARSTKGSSRRGARLIERHAADSGADITVHNGSGLGTANVCAPQEITAYLVTMNSSPLYSAFERTLPRAGADGTLRYRLRNTRAAEVVRAKTGTLTERREVAGRRVRRPLQDALAGYCRGRKRSLAFSLVNERADDRTGSRASIDRMVEAIVGYCD